MLRKLPTFSAVALICTMIAQMLFAQNNLTGPVLPTAAPTAVGMSPTHLAYLDDAIEAEIARKQLPGAVVVVGRQGKLVWRRAYGNRAVEPQQEAMTDRKSTRLNSSHTVISYS